MYIQLTTKCNMECNHCAYNCKKTGGMNMTMPTYMKALEIASWHGQYITLGGGEPTVHPMFKSMLMEAIACENWDDMVPHVITNGKKTELALLLAKLAKKEVIGAELSTDEFHEEIDPEVYEAFEGRHRDNARYSEMLLVGRYIEYTGASPEDIPEDQPCICEDWFVKPNGQIMACGCHDAHPVGHVSTGILSTYESMSPYCHRSQDYKDQLAEYYERLEEENAA